ncbi:CvpA family protein [Vagococcus sp. JNUCC 83]
MMLTVISILVLLTGFYAGYRRGFALQLVYFVGYAISFFMAKELYKTVGKKIELLIPYPAPTQGTKLSVFDSSLLFDLDKAFYAAFGFLIVLGIGYLITKFVGMLCYRLTFIPLVNKSNQLIGGLINLALTYIGLVIILTILSMVPIEFIQNAFAKSGTARTMIEHTPVLSSNLYQWFIKQIIL